MSSRATEASLGQVGKKKKGNGGGSSKYPREKGTEKQ